MKNPRETRLMQQREHSKNTYTSLQFIDSTVKKIHTVAPDLENGENSSGNLAREGGRGEGDPSVKLSR